MPLSLVSAGGLAPHGAQTAAAACRVRQSLDQIDMQSALDQCNHADVQLAALSSLLDIRQQLDAVGSAVPDACYRVHFGLFLDRHSEVSLLVGNVYHAHTLAQ